MAVVSYLSSRVSEPNLSGSASILLNPLFDIELRTIPNTYIYKRTLTITIFYKN